MSPAPPATPGAGAAPASSEVDWVRLDLASYTGIKDDEDEELNGDEAAHAGSEQRRDSRRPSDLPVGGVELLDDDSDSPQRDDTQQQHGLLRKMSRKVKTTLKMRPASSKDSSESESAPLPSFHARRKARLLEEKFELLDLTAEDVAEKPPVRKVSYLQHASWGTCVAFWRAFSRQSVPSVRVFWCSSPFCLVQYGLHVSLHAVRLSYPLFQYFCRHHFCGCYD